MSDLEEVTSPKMKKLKIKGVFTKKQLRRAEALLISRLALLGGPKMAPGSGSTVLAVLGFSNAVQPGVKSDPDELIQLADFIESGLMPVMQTSFVLGEPMKAEMYEEVNMHDPGT